MGETVAIVAALLRISETVRMQGNLIRMAIQNEAWDIDDMTAEECITEARRMIARAAQRPDTTPQQENT